eukprot:scaffold109078_cov63-Phaeocystis_antarctica.AAC.3
MHLKEHKTEHAEAGEDDPEAHTVASERGPALPRHLVEHDVARGCAADDHAALEDGDGHEGLAGELRVPEDEERAARGEERAAGEQVRPGRVEGVVVAAYRLVSGHALKHLHARLRGEGVAREQPGQRR